MKAFVLLPLILLCITAAYPQSKVTDFAYEITYFRCNNAKVLFYFDDSLDQGIDSCCWYFGDGVKKFREFSSDEDHTYKKPGVYSVTLDIWKNGIKNTITKDSIIKIYNPPEPAFKFTVSDTSFYAPLNVKFQNLTKKGEGDSLVYTWEIYSKDTILFEENPSFVFDEPGVYYIGLTVQDEIGCDAKYSDYIIVKDSAQRGEFDFNISGCYGDSEIPPCGYDKYFEIVNDTLKIYGFYYGNCGTNKTATVNYNSDTIAVKIWETGPWSTCGCGYCFEIEVPDILGDSTMVKFNDELHTAKIATLIDDFYFEKEEVRAYPNPAYDKLNIIWRNLVLDNFKYEIIDIHGMVRQSGVLNQKQSIIEFNKNRIVHGLYLLVIKANNEINYTGKIFITD